MNGLVKAICCHGSDACNEDPHTISGNHGHRPQCCHVSRALFKVLMYLKEERRLSGILKNETNSQVLRFLWGVGRVCWS